MYFVESSPPLVEIAATFTGQTFNQCDQLNSGRLPGKLRVEAEIQDVPDHGDQFGAFILFARVLAESTQPVFAVVGATGARCPLKVFDHGYVHLDGGPFHELSSSVNGL
ncbi:MAG: hypothetical protein KDM63_12300 [Verrucomicrobiae bacterium]|nr:hypothetical protein [Verrucomicrobiae bacterium]